VNTEKYGMGQTLVIAGYDECLWSIKARRQKLTFGSIEIMLH